MMTGRREQIMAALAQRTFLSVDEIVALLDCSVNTVRRDLAALAGEGRIRRTRGGAVASPAGETNGALPADGARTAHVYGDHAWTWLPVPRPDSHAAVKQRIARAAAALIEESDTIGLNGGTTTLEVARQVPHTLRLGALTNSIPVALELATRPGIRVLLLGGTLQMLGEEVTGLETEEMLERQSIGILFLSVDGLDAEAGATCINPHDAQVARSMVKRARRVIVVADQRKLGHIAMSRMFPLAAVSMLITDAHASPALEAMRAAGVQVSEA